MIKSWCHKLLLKLHGSRDDAFGQGQAQLYFAGYNHMMPYEHSLHKTTARFYDILRPSQNSRISFTPPSSAELSRIKASDSNLLGNDGYLRVS
jgi:hypothetical protein